MQHVKKIWGSETIFVNEPEYCLKELRILPGKRCSLHYHNSKKETFLVQSGFVRIERPGHPDLVLKHGDQLLIPPKTPHRFSSAGGAMMLEVSTHDDSEDCVRIEPSGDLQDLEKTR